MSSSTEESSLLAGQLPGQFTGMFNSPMKTFMKCNEYKVCWCDHVALSTCGPLHANMWVILFQQAVALGRVSGGH